LISSLTPSEFNDRVGTLKPMETTSKGIAQLLTLGGLGFWALSDLIELCRNRLKDNDGNSLV
jgi:hypothetical protein